MRGAGGSTKKVSGRWELVVVGMQHKGDTPGSVQLEQRGETLGNP
jgi:hypothetical protein